MTVGQNNLAFMHANTGDMHRAAEDMGLAVAIDLSLDQIAHPATQKCLARLLQFWANSDQIAKATRLAAGKISDLIPFVVRIEAGHRAWVAEDPDNRTFGPPSPITGATARPVVEATTLHNRRFYREDRPETASVIPTALTAELERASQRRRSLNHCRSGKEAGRWWQWRSRGRT